MNSRVDNRQLSRRLAEIGVGAATRVGPYLVDQFQRRVRYEAKGGYHDPVTECDRRSEQMISEYILEQYPDSAILGEEGGWRGTGSIRWYIDPIDGTNNFVSGLPFFCVSIAASDDQHMLAGIILDPVRQAVMTASLDGAFLNGERIRPTWHTSDATATLLTGFPYEGGRATAEDFAFFGRLVGHFRSVRRLGCTALELAAVALGHADVAFQTNTNPWDVAAGMFLLQQAGGCFDAIPLGERKEPDRPWMYPRYVATGAGYDLEHSSVRELFAASAT